MPIVTAALTPFTFAVFLPPLGIDFPDDSSDTASSGGSVNISLSLSGSIVVPIVTAALTPFTFAVFLPRFGTDFSEDSSDTATSGGSVNFPLVFPGPCFFAVCFFGCLVGLEAARSSSVSNVSVSYVSPTPSMVTTSSPSSFVLATVALLAVDVSLTSETTLLLVETFFPRNTGLSVGLAVMSFVSPFFCLDSTFLFGCLEETLTARSSCFPKVLVIFWSATSAISIETSIPSSVPGAAVLRTETAPDDPFTFSVFLPLEATNLAEDLFDTALSTGSANFS